MEYSQYEYDQHLIDSAWTAQETTYLFNMLREYDLRFIVVADRYAYQARGEDPVRTRTVEVSLDVRVGLTSGHQGSILCRLPSAHTNASSH
jgi:DNA methyltransferase 1-associated protein 1